MSLRLPSLFHWSPATNRERIQRRGLKPTTDTAVWVRPFRPGDKVGHFHEDLPDQSLKAVCLGTSPETAWAYSGAISAERGATWDLWEVTLHDTDETHLRPMYGNDLVEVRVVNRIPKSQVWYVASRTVQLRGRR